VRLAKPGDGRPVNLELIRTRIQAGQEQADALRHLGQKLRTLRAQADGELGHLRAGRPAGSA
jgi:hypothetical protein